MGFRVASVKVFRASARRRADTLSRCPRRASSECGAFLEGPGGLNKLVKHRGNYDYYMVYGVINLLTKSP